jgi:hypothetical protein
MTMQYLKAAEQSITEYPYDLAKLRLENPNTSFPQEMSDELLAEFGVYPVVPMDKPEATIYQRAVRATPIFVNGAWHEQWELVPARVPTKITPRQCRLILMSQGLLAQVEEIIATQDEATRITWEYASEFRRDDPLLNALAKNLNLEPEQIDQFFIAASKL